MRASRQRARYAGWAHKLAHERAPQVTAQGEAGRPVRAKASIFDPLNIQRLAATPTPAEALSAAVRQAGLMTELHPCARKLRC